MEKAVIFDLDGTLIDSLPDIHAALNKMLILRGVTVLSLDVVKGFIGKGSANLVTCALAEHGLPTDEKSCHTALNDFIEIYSSEAAKLTQVFEGVKEALGQLRRRNIRLGICTNKPIQPTKIVLNKFGLTSFFDSIVGGDQLVSRKPDPEMLYHTMRSLNVESCLFVGDSEVDCETALAAKQPFALFTKGYRKTSVESLDPKYYFGDYASLPNIVETVFRLY